MDTHEGSTVRLPCRFPPVHENATSFWLTHTHNDHDNAAIDNVSLAVNYKVHLDLLGGHYDLEIHNVSYERNNGKYECRVKESGSGRNLYHKNITLTVLKAPGPPSISPTSASATEGQRLELQCNTNGGSPEPEVKWYRGNSDTILHKGKTLVIIPTKDDDRAMFRCVVRNRAMAEGHTLNATVVLDVSYFPRVSVGPGNPLNVKAGGNTILTCLVDSKPKVSTVRWMKDGSFIAVSFNHRIPIVTLQDSGNYTCIADNNLGKHGESTLSLQVLYPPRVAIEGDNWRVAEVEDTVLVHCNISAKPDPYITEWLREGHPEFRQTGSILRIKRVTADQAGVYTCRAVNNIHPTGGEPQDHQATASVNVRVRHKPGPASITPDSPEAVQGNSVILTCMASPAGYPEPQFKWSKEGDGGPIQLQSSGSKLEIQSVHLDNDGIYKCHAMNEIGIGEAATVKLTVHLPPNIVMKLQPHVTRK